VVDELLVSCRMSVVLVVVDAEGVGVTDVVDVLRLLATVVTGDFDVLMVAVCDAVVATFFGNVDGGVVLSLNA
jgi:hypothetical protein